MTPNANLVSYQVTDRVAVVVTAPLTTNESWTAFKPGELKVFEGGALLAGA